MANIGTLSIGVDIEGIESAKKSVEDFTEDVDELDEQSDETTDNLELMKQRLGSLKNSIPNLGKLGLAGAGGAGGAGIISQIETIKATMMGIKATGSSVVSSVVGFFKSGWSKIKSIGSGIIKYIKNIPKKIPKISGLGTNLLAPILSPSFGALEVGKQFNLFDDLKSNTGGGASVNRGPVSNNLRQSGTSGGQTINIDRPKITVKSEGDLSDMSKSEKRELGKEINKELGNSFNDRTF